MSEAEMLLEVLENENNDVRLLFGHRALIRHGGAWVVREWNGRKGWKIHYSGDDLTIALVCLKG